MAVEYITSRNMVDLIYETLRLMKFNLKKKGGILYARHKKKREKI